MLESDNIILQKLMTEQLNISSVYSRDEKYRQLIPQICALIEGESNLIANLSNTSAALKQAFDFFWVGFYIVDKNELVLGPFQGSVACTRIGFGKGVCGSCWEQSETIIVPNVDEFPGHIACSSESKSEIVVPILSNGKVMAVLDVDSDKLDDFSQTDQVGLEELATVLAPLFK